MPNNYRIIDNRIHTGGHPLNPSTNFGNSDKQAMSILNHLKSAGVKTVIDLENTEKIQSRYKLLLKKAGLTRLHIPMSNTKVPNKKEWLLIKETMKRPVYIHCKWGADRTGAVIGRYLVEEKGFSPENAYKAVVTGGPYAGALGGFKKYIYNINLKNFIYCGPSRI